MVYANERGVSGVQLVTVDGVLCGRRRRRRVDAVAGRAQTARRRPESHLLSTSWRRAPTATQRSRARTSSQFLRPQGEPDLQLK